MNETRDWKCPECGHIEHISYDWLAQNGGPVCGECDCDMEFQPPPAIAADVLRLEAKCDAVALPEDALDALVHELANNIASDINAGGRDDQLPYLIVELGLQHTEREIDALINKKQDDEEV